jgi:hypothetical protein
MELHKDDIHNLEKEHFFFPTGGVRRQTPISHRCFYKFQALGKRAADDL